MSSVARPSLLAAFVLFLVAGVALLGSGDCRILDLRETAHAVATTGNYSAAMFFDVEHADLVDCCRHSVPRADALRQRPEIGVELPLVAVGHDDRAPLPGGSPMVGSAAPHAPRSAGDLLARLCVLRC